MNNLLTDSFEIHRDQVSRGGDVELGLPVPSSSELGLDDFNKKAEDIGKQIEKIAKLLKKLQDVNEESKSVTKAAQMKAIKQGMEKDIDEAMKIARTTKLKLEELNKNNITSRQKPGCEAGSGVDRIRATNTLALQKKFKEKLSEFQAFREKIRQEYREVVERRVFTVTGDHADEETIDRLIETGNSEQIFQKAIQEQGRGQVLDILAEIHERHDAVREIEEKLLELQQIFRDISVLVDAQQVELDDIQKNVENTDEYVNRGVKALTYARKLQKNSRKCTCIAIILLLIIAIIIVLSLHPWS